MIQFNDIEIRVYECRHRDDDGLMVTIELAGQSHPEWQILAEGADVLSALFGVDTSMDQVRARRVRTVGHNGGPSL